MLACCSLCLDRDPLFCFIDQGERRPCYISLRIGRGEQRLGLVVSLLVLWDSCRPTLVDDSSSFCHNTVATSWFRFVSSCLAGLSRCPRLIPSGGVVDLVLHTILVVAGSYVMSYQLVCLRLNRVLMSESDSYVSLPGMVIGTIPWFLDLEGSGVAPNPWVKQGGLLRVVTSYWEVRDGTSRRLKDSPSFFQRIRGLRVDRGGARREMELFVGVG